MSGNHAAIDIDVEYEPVAAKPVAPASSFRETSDNVLEVSQRFSTKPESFPTQFPATTSAFAKACEVSEVTIRKWLRKFGEVVPSHLLSQQRGEWTELAGDMIHDFNTYRLRGWAIDRWLDQVAKDAYAPAHVKEAEAVVFEAEKNRGAIIPAETNTAADSVEASLALAMATANSAQTLLDQVFDTLDQARDQRQRQQRQAQMKRLIAEETLAIVEEEQLREKIRAGIIARRQAAADAELQERLAELGGEP